MTRRAQYVACCHITDVSTHMTYSSVFSSDTVLIGLLMAYLNNSDVLDGDIHNVFFGAPTTEKILSYAGNEWKSDEDKVVIAVRLLYGLKYSDLQFQNCLSGTLSNMIGYRSSVDEPDHWYKPMTDTDYFEYYSYMLVYVDDLLLIMKC